MSVTATRIAVIAVVACATAAPAVAQDQKAPVVVAPLSTLGADTRSKTTMRIERDLIAGLSAVPGFAVTAGKDVRDAVKRAKRPDLRTCDGDVACLADLGTLMGAQYVIYGELGGLGDAQVVALKVVDVAAKRELRSTTAQFGDGGEPEVVARAAGYRLLAPSRYVGTLVLKVDVDDATIYLDGNKVATSPSGPIRTEVGNHALRVTHPEYRDFVRFVDIAFDAQVDLEVPMQAFPIVDSEMRQKERGGPVDPGTRRKAATPWYYRWYTIAGAGAVLAIGSAVVIGMLSDGVDADREETVGD